MKQTTLIILLVSSLIVNAFLAGYLVSSARHPHGPPPMSPTDRMEIAAKHLDAPYKDKVEKLVSESQGRIDTDMQKMHSLFERIHPVLTANEFKSADLKALHKQIYKTDDRIKEHMLELLTRIATILPKEQRISFFNEIKPDNRDFPGPPHGPPPGDFPPQEK